MLCFHGNGFVEGTFGSFFFLHIFAVYLIFFALYVLVINQGDIISSYYTDIIAQLFSDKSNM